MDNYECKTLEETLDDFLKKIPSDFFQSICYRTEEGSIELVWGKDNTLINSYIYVKRELRRKGLYSNLLRKAATYPQVKQITIQCASTIAICTLLSKLKLKGIPFKKDFNSFHWIAPKIDFQISLNST